ncbi:MULTISPECIES: TrmH family RNA methyltransferase [Maribacter]|uniref:tRNA (guanosine(18)-2'-O)-methyltransferase n=1 Tax=Maribacter flavus TaxID=1658664 RepID=A0ABU7IJP2_9FLAO|nr:MULTISPECIES: RNA methyltransferase [Maribacter]MDC6406028.1 RNA methyltransferase [Maribacter sp. PR66]MEE1973187.1 RNA methyltransferase [Maribacter flavus]
MGDKELLHYLEGFISVERKQRFLSILKNRTNFISVAIEDVYQMHNTSAVIRSCESFGVQKAHLIEGRFGKRLDKKIAMGAQQWVDIHRYTSVTEAISVLREQGYKIVATSPHADSSLLTDFKLEAPIALFFGTEKEGLSQEVMEKADMFLKVPMVGFTESLNISVSAAIILQDLTAKLRQSDLPWQLTDAEILEKRLDWTKKSIRSIEDILNRFYRTK